MLIKSHEEHASMEEGEEAMSVELQDPHNDEDDDNDNGDDDAEDDLDGNDEDNNDDAGDDDAEDEDDGCDDDEDDDGYKPTLPVPDADEAGDATYFDHLESSGPSSASTDVVATNSASSSAGNASISEPVNVHQQMLETAIAAGLDPVVHMLRRQMKQSKRNKKGRNLLCHEMVSGLADEKHVADAGKRAVMEEARKKDLLLIHNKRNSF